MNVTFEKDATVYELNVESLPAASVAYLLQYGFNQSLQDCIAGRAKAVRAERVAAGDDADAIELAIMADIEGKLGKRVDAIKNGTMGLPTTRDPVATLGKEIVENHLRAQGKKVSKEKLAELVATYVEKSRPQLVAELARRKSLDAVPAVDLDI